MRSKLRVISGHGGTDVGAVATIPAHDVELAPARDEPQPDGTVIHHLAVTRHVDESTHVELDLNIAAVLSFNDAASRDFKPHDVTVITYPRSERDGNEVLLEKIAKANEAGPDQILIEVHHNVGAPEPGMQVWYSQNAKNTAGDETWLVLPFITTELGFLIGAPVPTIESSRSRFGKLGILDDTTCTAVLIEARNVASVTGPDWEYAFGVALARAMARYFGWPPALEPPAPPVIDTAAAAKLVTAKALVADLAAKIGAL